MSTKHVSSVSRPPQPSLQANLANTQPTSAREASQTTEARDVSAATDAHALQDAGASTASLAEHQFEAGGRSALLQDAAAPTLAAPASSPASPELSSSLRGQLATAHLVGSGRAGGAMGVRSGGMVRSGSGPVDVARWQRHPEQVLGHLTQRAASGSGAAAANEADRCGAANLLGVSVMAGPEATRQMLLQAAENRGTSLTEQGREQLRTIAGHIDPAHPESSSITFEELSQAQGLLYQAGNTRADALGEINEMRQILNRANPSPFGARPSAEDRAASRPYEEAIGTGDLSRAAWQRLQSWDGHAPLQAYDQQLLQRLMQVHRGPGEYPLTSAPDPQDPSRREWFFQTGPGIGGTDHSRFDDGELRQLAARTMGRAGSQETEQPRRLEDLLGSGATGLRSGQAATFRVQADARTSQSSDHYITVGRSPNGQYYLYNPDPGPGDATLVTGSRAQVMSAAGRYDGRMPSDGDGDLPNLILTRPHGA
ncbi:MAG: hypothetical protein H6727_03240 [Myxococcales bacterium]|nr:hypothetical protein [Myxococcales bacterium]